MVRVGVGLLCIASLALLATGCGVVGGVASIDDIVLTSALDADYCPVDEVTTFSPNDPFYCSVKATNLQPGSTVTSRWYFGSEFIEEINYQVQTGGFGCVGFELTSSNAWPRGGYRVEIYLDGHLERTASFAVT